MGTGMNENRVDYPSSATAAPSVLPFALEGVFFKVRHEMCGWSECCAKDVFENFTFS
jgi:hypothetical protein